MRPKRVSRRSVLVSAGAAIGCLWHNLAFPATSFGCSIGEQNPELQRSVERGLNWLAKNQTRLGHWPHDTYPTAIAASVELPCCAPGRQPLKDPMPRTFGRRVDYLISKCRRNGLIGDPKRDNRYTYGHGFAMLFLSQVLGEEEDVDRRAN